MKPVDLILFDAVGTLIYPEPPVVTAYATVAAELGHAITGSDLSSRFAEAMACGRDSRNVDRAGQTSEAGEMDFWRGVVTKVLAEVPQSRSEAAFQRLWQHFAEPKHWQLFEDVAPTLTELRRRGYCLGIASNFDQRLIGICKQLPPLDELEDLFVSSRVGWAKPANGFYSEVQRVTQFDPARVLMVGDDQENDVAAPQRNGWKARWLVREPAMRRDGCIKSLTELLDELPQ